ncbi:TOMM precursor leader peptide-binding protein [Arthrobacter sp. JSM 101049]|uniref:TOMM precursor leader peptide-binding protein n=1 Tax=Arthrobacter sp. JSM 101049 TaxID=929097 RepID=UPI0035651AB2
MRIIPELQVVRVSETSLRIGGRDDGLWISGLTPADQDFIVSLASPDLNPADAGTQGNGAAAIGTRRRDQLLELLAPVLEEPFRLPGALGATLAPDVTAFSSAYSTSAGQLVRNRSRSTARIWGLGRCGQAIAALLAASGIGALYLHDDLPVQAGDIGAGPLRIADLGKARTVAVAHRLGQQWPRTRLARWEPAPDDSGLGAQVSIVTACDTLPERVADHLAATRIPHLPVLFGPSWARIGPLVIPGLTTCLDCADTDDVRSADLPRTAGSPRSGSSTAELAMSATAAGLATMQVMMLLDGVNVPSTADAVLTVDLSTGGVHRIPVEPHPGCTCMIPAA